MTKSFKKLVPELTKMLTQHHQLYSGQCKAELWEEICAKALLRCGLGADWKPDFNHVSGVDQTTDCGVRISNKGGMLKNDLSKITISGSRLTRHKTLAEKVEFLSVQKEDYIFCLGTTDEWNHLQPVYHFIVIDSKDLDYTSDSWQEMYGARKNNKSSVVGYRYTGKNFTAKIMKSMSDQLWTVIDRSLFKEIHTIDIT